jgi:energy-coupling factor transport system permease protein
MSMQGGLPIAMIAGDSVIHRIHPLVKIVWVVGYVLLAFSTQNIIILYTMAALAFLFAALAGVLRPLSKALIIIVPTGASLLALQILAPAVPKPWTSIGQIGPVELYGDGLYYGFVLLGRILCCLILALVMVMTTHPSDLFTTFARLKVPYTFNFMLAMTLQLIPVFQREVGIIMSAQKSRGMKGSGFQAVLPSFVPVFVGAIERVQQLSISLESRGFGSDGVKTSYRQVHGRPMDWVFGVVGISVMVLLVVLSFMKGFWSLAHEVHFAPGFVFWTFVVAATLFLAMIGTALVFSLKR